MQNEVPPRSPEVVVISDIHLGTFACQAKAVLQYLKSVRPKTLVLNGDIVDTWQFSKTFWPKSHMQVIRQILKMASEGTEVYYVTGNHDEMMRKFVGMRLGNFQVVNKVILTLDGKKAWIFHGDVFDVTMKHGKWLARMGANGYACLLQINQFFNLISKKLGYGPFSLARRIKTAVKAKHGFEQTAADLAIEKGYDYVICGHIHRPEIKTITNKQGSVLYLNSGDWIERLTALEYQNGEWTLYQHEPAQVPAVVSSDLEEIASNKQLFQKMLLEFDLA